MAPDLFIYAIVAAGLVVWLRNVLGTKHGDERHRPNPFLQPTETEVVKSVIDAVNRSQGGAARIAVLIEKPGKVAAIDTKEAGMGLLDIAGADKTFDIDFFMQAAQDSFALIVEAFAKGEKDTLEGLLAPAVLNSFNAAIDARVAAGEIMNTEILSVKKAAVTDAKLEVRMAYVTIAFEAEEISVTKDKNGAVIAGHPERVTIARDVWVFGRDIRSNDPRWLVHETRGGAGEDSALQ